MCQSKGWIKNSISLFNPDDEGDTFPKNVVDFHQTIWHYIPEDRTLHNHHCENLKSNIWEGCLNELRGAGYTLSGTD
jgi:hypothetical protein